MEIFEQEKLLNENFELNTIKKLLRTARKQENKNFLRKMVDKMIENTEIRKKQKKLIFKMICELGDEMKFEGFLLEENQKIEENQKTLYHCCYGGNKKIVERMMELGSNDYEQGNKYS